MADPDERDIEHALIALKKGTRLIKYSRKGKPKLCPFRLSSDETTLLWYSREEERSLALSSISKIIPGQRTAVFRRYRCPEKDYLSFSLLYNNGERSLDLICRDKFEVEVWFTGLKALITPGQHNRHTRSDNPDIHGAADFLQNGCPFGATLEITSSLPRSINTKQLAELGPTESNLNVRRSNVGSDRANMQPRTSSSTGDGFRISISSAPSCSSQGSGPDEIDNMGDVYIWGEVWCDGSVADGSKNASPSKNDVLLPKPLETNLVLDVLQISCGVKHAAFVTKQGAVFTWGEESGGLLGHAIDKDFSSPKIIECFDLNNSLNTAEYVSCGEYHTCVISGSGELFTWGDGTLNVGLLGHPTDVSHWLPKRISGPLEGFQVSSIACGTWHSALSTSDGKLFTFGDGTFGALGHGDQESVAYPREVESLSGLKTVKVACGVWHTAAIIEVVGQLGANLSSRKLFTWGAGDKYRLGHGDKEPRLVPTCIPSLVDYNFQQIACGHDITVALTTSGHVFTMGSTAYGQLGNPLSDGKLPVLVQDKLVGQFVDEISCGAFHVAVLASASGIFTWGKGSNGRLGHGDVEDRKGPTLVEALKDRCVKSIACGFNFTASICIHKSGPEQSNCNGCRQPFSFTRKRHSCYHCGQVYCHSCSSKKALKPLLATTSGKPLRVCDSCYAKLKAIEIGTDMNSNIRRDITPPRRWVETRERFDKGDFRSKVLISPSTEPVKYLEIKSSKHGTKTDSLSIIRASQVPSLLQLKDVAFPSTLSVLQNALKPVATSTPQQTLPSRPVSPYTKRPSPPRSTTPVFPKSIIDNLKKTNELLNQEVLKMHSQVRSLRQKCDLQDVELQKSQQKTQKATSLAEEKSLNCIVAKEAFRFIEFQLKGMKDKLPPEVHENEHFKAIQMKIESFLKTDNVDTSEAHFPPPTDSSVSNEQNMPDEPHLVNEISATAALHTEMDDNLEATLATVESNGQRISDSHESIENDSSPRISHNDEGNVPQVYDHQKGINNDARSPRSSMVKNDGNIEVIEQFEPGVFVTLVRLKNGTKVFKRVKFSKKRFSGKQAEVWWKENQSRVLQKYHRQGNRNESSTSAAPTPTEEEDATSSSKT